MRRSSFVCKWVLLILAVSGVTERTHASPEISAKRPNILWLTFEDTSANEFALYGNPYLKTPNIEKLADDGLVFKYAYSNAPYCSPARSSLISGSYATTFGSDHHRAIVESPADRVYFPALLKQAGYFTTNNSKRDYNVELSKSALAKIWSEWDNKASYNSPARAPEQPFFAVFNAGMTHMSRLTSYHLEGRRDFSKDGISANAHPGAYLPNLPAVRSDYQFHLEGVYDVDRWVKIFIDDLKQQGLFDNTIIFVYSDHGGSSPRGKGFLFNSGTQVPLVVHIPKQYKHLISEDPKATSEQVVEFVDFGPTVLSLAGIKPPSQMQGEAFMGPYAQPLQKYAYNFRTNQERHFDPWRGVTNGKFNYFKTYLTRKPISLRNAFQWGMPSNLALDAYAHQTPESEFSQAFYQPKSVEYLYDLTKDPNETNNLANDPKYQTQLKQMRQLVAEHIAKSGDLGFIPVAMKQGKQYGNWFTAQFTFKNYFDLINRVSQAKSTDVDYFAQYLTSKNPVARFWAANGFAELAAKGVSSTKLTFTQSQTETHASVRAVMFEALAYSGHPQAVMKLIEDRKNDHAISALETIAYTKPWLLKPHLSDLQALRHEESVRSILANLGIVDVDKVAVGQYGRGLKVNQVRRPLKPLPN
ncbi:sulfatase-like hydrolase/transferase [Gayadomonas joobiniege]|uniref:sulfatase-like hydrolase/transferase n=1 Tax=Gayadomonas joobiniege TaxID=1234606 RepID=UPI00037ED977|nr:sulfatase [Gayadomonas joobiniege]